MGRALLLMGFMLAATCGAARADVYKWVDANGVVNYGDAPPKAQAATALPGGDSHITVYSPVPPSPRDLAQLDAEQRLRQSLRIIEAQQAPMVAAAAPYDPGADWYARCMREMFADCDDPRALVTRYGGGYAGGYVSGYVSGYGNGYWGAPVPAVVVGARSAVVTPPPYRRPHPPAIHGPGTHG
jgi:hypothetical protein